MREHETELVSAMQSTRLTYATSLYRLIALTIGLFIWNASRSSQILTNGEWLNAGLAGAALLCYIAEANWARRTQSADIVSALVFGARLGVLIGAFAVLNHSAEVFVNIPSPGPAILGVGMWASMFFGFGMASVVTYQKTGSIVAGIISSLWSALVSAGTLVLYAFLVGLIFETNASRDAVIRNLFQGASIHLILVPLLALIVGTGSVLESSIFRQLARRTLVMLASADVMLLPVGLCAVYFASTLERSERPPFVMFGLGSLFVSLASAYPLASTIRLRLHRRLKSRTAV